MTFWSNDEDELLRIMWTAGLGSTKISKYFSNRSRNSVIGRAFRLGLLTPRPPGQPRRISAAKIKQHESEIANSTPNTALRRVVVARARSRGELPPRVKTVPRKRPDGLIRFEQLSYDSCRWPYGDVGDRNFGFCGAERKSLNSPYCAKHHGKAHQDRVRR